MSTKLLNKPIIDWEKIVFNLSYKQNYHSDINECA